MADEPVVSLDVIERNSQYFLTRDDVGFALWSVRGDATDPVLTFPAGEEGESRARAAFARESRIGTWAGFFLITSIASAIVWIVAELGSQLLQLTTLGHRFASFGDERLSGADLAAAWAASVATIANTSFTIAVGLSVALWLHRRYRREG